MADSKHIKTKSKLSSYKEDKNNKSHSKKSRVFKDVSTKHYYESKTPPLPIKSNCSISDLLKQRDNLKKELNNIKVGTLIEKKNVQDDKKIKSYSRKRLKNYDDHIKKKKVRTPSPSNCQDDFQIESEDEETIIEQRRKQRKQLLEKLTHSQMETNMNKDVNMINKSEKYKGRIENDKNQQVPDEIHSDSKISTDMFAEKDEFASHRASDMVTQDNEDNNTQLTDNWDDSEGYYNIKVGDMINSGRYTIKSTLGQGVFANVVNSLDNKDNKSVAIKIVRNNDLMYKTGLKEISILKEVNEADPEDKYHCVKLFSHFMHKGHLCMVLEPLHMDLRCVIKKYGKHHGISMKALMSYSRQLLMALRHLKKIGLIHADIKPDNILVNEKKNILKLCDFGSAVKVNNNDATPYLVSRFYRAPEIILGMPYQHGVDLWSAACTIYEMATGKIMFTGSSNNKMLKCFMDMKGKFPGRLIRKGKFKDQHFNYNNNYLLHKKDELTGREKVVEICNIVIKRDLAKELKKSCKFKEDEFKINQLHDLLDKMVMLDPKQRISITDSLKHSFIQEQLHK